jgi:hypothetical protein
MFAQHVGKKINEFSEYYDDSIETVLDDEGR